MRRPRFVAALLTAVALAGCSSPAVQQPGTAARTAPASASAVSEGGPSQLADLAPARPTTDLATVAASALPPEGIDTLVLIRDGGPFPFDSDGATFQNREGILPDQPRGFYAEYTVITPGEDDRGARRIVAGENGSRFYTADHYGSFREVVSG